MWCVTLFRINTQANINLNCRVLVSLERLVGASLGRPCSLQEEEYVRPGHEAYSLCFDVLNGLYTQSGH